jgi:predicted RNA polymerase sigma factor
VRADDDSGTRRTAELAARSSYGRLVAYLVARSRDVSAAEDALGAAFLAALETWPRAGVPEKPEAWLLAAGRRRLVDAARHVKVEAAAAAPLRILFDGAEQEASESAVFPDERLKLLFVCAHPAIDETVRTPLMLQTVLGLDAARIASAFLVTPATMGQRLVRAKAKIRDAGIQFEIPERQDLPARVEAVLEAIYAAYGSAWEDVAGAHPRRQGLAEEAIWLGRLVNRLLADEPEAQGLLALMLHCEARREARRDGAGHYVPLSLQNTARWSQPLIAEAEEILSAASRACRLGRFQLEAAIQSVHAQRAVSGRTDWEAIALLYEGLIRSAPTTGARVGYAAALAEVKGAEAGLAALHPIPSVAVQSYQPYWALMAHLLQCLGRDAQATDAYARAIVLSEDTAVREFLAARSSAMTSG